MTTQTQTSPTRTSNRTSKDWAKIIGSAGKAAGKSMQDESSAAQTKMAAKEKKRRTIANLLNQALKRKQSMFRAGQEYGGEMADTQSQALQNVAKGFIQSLRG